MYVKIDEINAMIDYSNIEIHKMIDCVGCCEAETNHWLDQFYKMLKDNVKRLKTQKFNDKKS